MMHFRSNRRARALAAVLAVLIAVTALGPVQAMAGAAPMPGVVADILRDIIDSDYFRQEWDFEPLVSATDMNEDGVWEMLAVYECVNGTDYYVFEQVWLIDGETEEAKQVGSGVLFREVGGNSGTMSLVDRDGELGVLIMSHEPDGADFRDRYDYFSLAEGDTKLGSEYIMLDRSGTYGQEDDAEYTVDMDRVSRQEFEDILDSMEPCRTLDILAGPDEHGDVISFNVMFT